MGEPSREKHSSISIVLLLCLLVVGPPIAGVVAMVRAREQRVSARRRAEVRSNLKAALVGEMALYSEKDRYSEYPREIGFSPERANRYLYVLASRGPLQQRNAAALPTDVGVTGFAPDTFKYPGTSEGALLGGVSPALLGTAGVSGECPRCNVTIVAAGNLDDDPTIDVWSVSTAERVAADGAKIPAGVPWCEVDDLDEDD